MGSLLFALALLPRPVLSGTEATADTVDGTYRVHYTLGGADALFSGAGDLDTVRSGLEEVIAHWVKGQGMRAPLPDGGEGGDNKIDVYLRALDGPRGATHPEDVGHAPAASAWIELDPRSALDGKNRFSAAAGHEAHHAIQYAYSTTLAPWIYEATAAYVEHADFTGDGLQAETDAHFAALLQHPEVPLDTFDGRHEYDEMALIAWVVANHGGDGGVAVLWDAAQRGNDVLSALVDLGLGMTLPRRLADHALWLLAACNSSSLCKTAHAPYVEGVPTFPFDGTETLAPLARKYLRVPQPVPPLPDCAFIRFRISSGGTDIATTYWSTTLSGPLQPGDILAFGRGRAPGSEFEVRFASDSAACVDGGVPRNSAEPGCGCDLGRSPEGSPPTWLLLVSALLVRGRRRGGRARP